ncbi:MAG: ParB/RepB/Spo0J family partition protein, partial [Patescibacteria group bacterium]
GHRRFQACRMVGLLRIPCVVREVSDEAAFGIMASENLVREDVDPVDEAVFIEALITKTKKNTQEVAAMIRRSVGYVEDRLVVAKMPDYMRQYLKTKQLKLGAALALVQIDNDNLRRTWVELAVRDGASVRQAEYWLYQWRADQLPTGVGAGEFLPGADPTPYKPPLFVCAIDGKEYPVNDTTMVTVYKGNLRYLAELRSALASEPEKADPSLVLSS